jgi:hypothetical protein
MGHSGSLPFGTVSEEPHRLQCPFCEGYDVDRLYLASLSLDSCACTSCGARWDEKVGTGEFVGRGSSATVLSPRLP